MNADKSEDLRHQHTVRSTALYLATLALLERIHAIRDSSPWRAASGPIAGELAELAARAGDYNDLLLRASADDIITPRERAALTAHRDLYP